MFFSDIAPKQGKSVAIYAISLLAKQCFAVVAGKLVANTKFYKG